MLNLTFGNLWKVTFRLLITFGKDLEDLGSFWEVTFGLEQLLGRIWNIWKAPKSFPKVASIPKGNIYMVGQKHPKAQMLAFQKLPTGFQMLQC